MKKTIEIISGEDDEFYSINPQDVVMIYVKNLSPQVILTLGHKVNLRSYELFSKRLDYALNNDYNTNSPICNPVKAFSNALVDNNSCRLLSVKAEMQPWFTEEEQKAIAEISSKLTSTPLPETTDNAPQKFSM